MTRTDDAVVTAFRKAGSERIACRNLRGRFDQLSGGIGDDRVAAIERRLWTDGTQQRIDPRQRLTSLSEFLFHTEQQAVAKTRECGFLRCDITLRRARLEPGRQRMEAAALQM